MLSSEQIKQLRESVEQSGIKSDYYVLMTTADCNSLKSFEFEVYGNVAPTSDILINRQEILKRTADIISGKI